MKARAVISTVGFVLAGMLLFSSIAAAADLTVMYSGAFSAAIKDLARRMSVPPGTKS